MSEKEHSRRKFLKYVGAGAVVAVAGFVAQQQVLPQLLRPQNSYPKCLRIDQNISSETVEYPPVKSSALDFKIELQNIAPVSIKNITFRVSGLKGFELKSAKYQDKEITVHRPNGNEDLTINLPEAVLEPGWIRELQLTYESGLSSQTSNILTEATGQYFQEGNFGFGKGYMETVSNKAQATIQVVPLPKTLAELYQQGKQEWVKEILDRKILLQYPVPTEIQEKYWRDPNERNSEEVVEYLFSELQKNGEPFRELAAELHKLPDLKEAKYNIDLVKAFENILSLFLLYETPKDNILRMLDEGIKEKRKYCTPLQALVWLERAR